MTTQYVLVKSCFNWSDEFDVEGLWVTTREEFDSTAKEIQTLLADDDEVGLTTWFDSNQCIEIRSYHQWTSGISVMPISEQEAESFMKAFGGNCFGVVVIPD